MTSLPGTLTASPIAQSSIIDVQATASSETEALKLANAGAAALETIVTQVTNDNQSQVAPIVNAFQKADSAYEQATAQYNLLQHQLNTFSASSATTRSPPSDKKYENYLNSQIAAALTKADTVQAGKRQLLQRVLRGCASASGPARDGPARLELATYSGSNRKSLY